MRLMAVTVGLALATIAFGASSARSQNAIKIGVISPITGNSATQGLGNRDAIRVAFEEEGNTVAGRKIELLFEDSAGRAELGLTKAKALVERDGVQMLLGEMFSPVGAAIAPYVVEKKVPWVNTVSLASLTRSLKSPYIFRFVPSSYQFGDATAQIVKKKGWKKVYFLGWNSPVSREAFEALKLGLGEGSIVEAMFPNIGTSDYAPYLAKLTAGKADAVIVAIWGADAPRFVQQYADAGLNRSMPLFGMASFTTEELLGGMPPATEGVWSAYTYCGTLDTPENKTFIEKYRTRQNNNPGSYQHLNYMAAKMVIQALKDINGKIEDKDAFIAALEKVKIKGPMGQASFDSNHGMVGDFYLLHVSKDANGKLVNQCTERLPQIQDPYSAFP